MKPIVDLRKKTLPKKDLVWLANYQIHASSPWRIAIIAILVAVIVTLFLTNGSGLSVGFLIAVLIVIGLRLIANRQPLEIKVDQSSIQVGDRQIGYEEIESFWITFRADGLQELSLRQRSWYLPYLKVPIDGQDPVRLRNFLIRFLVEQPHEESVLDHLTRKLGL
ncbi:MAG: hypothetical protein COV31_02635 [Candidatus Yanofskybacteria bacterium CG10_big_fil_rev_8_21_14_0_10_46_23]|uniref:DUF5673 domain-containing protein n=1 Tax=Candidatus Yanofskybacteria bacterium CG10_big_fil_rev_8_21_14_0_10_46_23 TaxID=1975098 RepID=A0A2H0R4N6_9BACT|nr:MAG: hypothetical protein COV31_02635 [Candidatus Yanofskybacteria bacterium CG10_big_fil_rev_8_21_14_0_10_46_23]